MFDHILLVLLLLADVLCWYEARRSGNVMKLYFLERKKWYSARTKKTEQKTSDSNPNMESVSTVETRWSENKKANAKSVVGLLMPMDPQTWTTSTFMLKPLAITILFCAALMDGMRKRLMNMAK